MPDADQAASTWEIASGEEAISPMERERQHVFRAASLPVYGTASSLHRSVATMSSSLTCGELVAIEGLAIYNILPISCLYEAALQALLYRYRGYGVDPSTAPTFRNITMPGTTPDSGNPENSFRVGIGVGSNVSANADLFLMVKKTRGELSACPVWHYRQDLFAAQTIEAVDRHFATLLRSLVASPDLPISEHRLLEPDELETILGDWNDTKTDYPGDQSLATLFAKVAQEHSTKTAIKDGNILLTYHDLDQRAEVVAAQLVEAGACPGDRVGIALERSAAMVVAMVAILKAGATYVPLDPSYPSRRIQYMIYDSDVRLVVTDGVHKNRVPNAALTLNLDDVDMGRALSPTIPANSGHEVAYIMYTSGSSGPPKGVEITQRAIVRLVKNTNYVDLGANDVIAQVSNASFDAVTFEVWGALLHGGCLSIISNAALLSPHDLAAAIATQGITALFLTSAVFDLVAADCPTALAHVRYLIVGGDVVNPRSAQRILANGPPLHLINGYGPTESTTFALTYSIDHVADEAASIPIGRPVANTEAYILDASMHPVPCGIPGVLYLGGDGLATGYINQPERTRERFVSDPFHPGSDRRLYRTGDVARFRPDGEIEFLGREDDQVKISGFRIELNEIALALKEHAEVHDSISMVDVHPKNGKRLIAYVSSPHGTVGSDELRHFLHARLPHFAVPNEIVVVGRFPLTPNGKVDRGALRHVRSTSKPPATESEEPTLTVEATVTAGWKNILSIDAVGLDDNFFDLGGDSLRLALLAQELHRRLPMQFSIVDLFRYPTIRSFTTSLQPESGQDIAMQRARSRALKGRNSVESRQHAG